MLIPLIGIRHTIEVGVLLNIVAAAIVLMVDKMETY